MEQFYKDYFGALDAPLVFALGLLAATALTAFWRFVGNLETWLGRPNPLHDYDTDSLMPLFAAIQGGIYGLCVGPAPGLTDNLKFSILYAGGSTLTYYLVRRLVDTWGLGNPPPPAKP